MEQGQQHMRCVEERVLLRDGGIFARGSPPSQGPLALLQVRSHAQSAGTEMLRHATRGSAGRSAIRRRTEETTNHEAFVCKKKPGDAKFLWGFFVHAAAAYVEASNLDRPGGKRDFFSQAVCEGK
jgi:hypothetical protein